MSTLPNRDDDPFGMAQQMPAAGPYVGPLARPYTRRSQYLLQALEAMREGSQQISSPAELGTRLLAQALLQYGQTRNERALVAAQGQDAQNELARMESVVAALGGGGQSQPPTAAAPSQPPPSPSAPATAGALASGPPASDAGNLAAALGAGDRAAARPPSLPDDLDDNTRDTLARLLIGEAPPEGRQAVANVVFNRAQAAGMNPMDVIAQPHQFEPYGNRRTWERLQQISPDSPEYQNALQAIEQARQRDVTNGATHFYSPTIMDQRGGPPSWARGQQGTDIGGNRFLNLPFRAPPGYQRQPAQGMNPPRAATPQSPGGTPPPPPPPPPMPPPGSALPGGGMPPAPPPGMPQQPQQPQPQAPPQSFPGVQTQGQYVFTPQVMAVLQAEMRSGDPQRIAAARQRFAQLQYQAAQPMRWQPQSVNGLPGSFNPYTGETVTGQLPPQAQSRIVTAEEAGIPGPPGMMVSLDPTGRATVITRPENGQMVLSAPGQPYREGAVPGGSRDLTNPQNRFAGEQQLVDDYRRDVAQYVDVRGSMQRIIAAAQEADRMAQLGQNQAPADIALITSYMRLLDPGVSVREGEYATAANAGSIPENVRAMWNRVVTGGTLTPEQRAGFVSSARTQYAPYEDRYSAINQHYRSRAQSYGFDARNIIQEFPPLFPPQEQRQPQPTTQPGQAQQPQVYPPLPSFLQQQGGAPRSGPAPSAPAGRQQQRRPVRVLGRAD